MLLGHSLTWFDSIKYVIEYILINNYLKYFASFIIKNSSEYETTNNTYSNIFNKFQHHKSINQPSPIAKAPYHRRRPDAPPHPLHPSASSYHTNPAHVIFSHDEDPYQPWPQKRGPLWAGMSKWALNGGFNGAPMFRDHSSPRRLRTSPFWRVRRFF